MRRNTNTDCVVKVGAGRGFIVVHRGKAPPFPARLQRTGIKRASVLERRLVVTAAHCLPHFPPAHAGAHSIERTYERILANLDGSKKDVWAECLFVDPVADIAVLGCPDEEKLSEEADAFSALIDSVSFLPIGKAKSGPGWVLSLDGRWIPSRLEISFGAFNVSLSIDPTEAGMSGSPILNDVGQAVGIVAIGAETIGASGQRENERSGPQPILARNAPGWMLSDV